MNQIEALEFEIEREATRRHDEVLTCLIHSVARQPLIELGAALNRYVGLKLRLHRLKRRYESNDDWWGNSHPALSTWGGEAYHKEYNDLHSKMINARREYYDARRKN